METGLRQEYIPKCPKELFDNLDARTREGRIERDVRIARYIVLLEVDLGGNPILEHSEIKVVRENEQKKQSERILRMARQDHPHNGSLWRSVSKLRSSTYHGPGGFNEADLQNIALEKGVFDDIWPPRVGYKKHFGDLSKDLEIPDFIPSMKRLNARGEVA